MISRRFEPTAKQDPVRKKRRIPVFRAGTSRGVRGKPLAWAILGVWAALGAWAVPGSGAGGPSLSAAEPIRVMSFNVRFGTANDGINHWDNRKEFLVETIREFDPDLLGTQETLGFQRDYLQEHLDGYEVLGVGRDDGQEAGEMMALYYRSSRFRASDGGHFWLSEAPAEVGSKSWDSSLPRMCTWVKLEDRRSPDRRPILFMNTHFDHRGTVARRESAALLRRMADRLGEGCDVVLTGDFNAPIDSDPYRELVTAPPDATRFVDTYAVAKPENEPGEGTFTAFRGSVTEGARIDWILVRGDWEIESAAINRTQREGRTPSDHYPVEAVIRR